MNSYSKLRIFHVLLHSVAFDHGPLTSRSVSYGILNTKLRCITVFDGVYPVLLRMSLSVTVITTREVYRHKMAYHGDKFLHIGAITIVNNTDHTLHYAIEEELQSRTYLINSAVVC